MKMKSFCLRIPFDFIKNKNEHKLIIFKEKLLKGFRMRKIIPLKQKKSDERISITARDVAPKTIENGIRHFKNRIETVLRVGAM